MFLDPEQLAQCCIDCIFAWSLADAADTDYEVHAEQPEDEDEYYTEPQLVYDYDASDPDDT